MPSTIPAQDANSLKADPGDRELATMREIDQLPFASSPATSARAAGSNLAPRVAVLMAAFNAESTIIEAVDSILSGTEPSHLYIVDDCSRTPVKSVLGAADDRITIIRLDSNAGPGRARNAGLEHILAGQCAYVAIMDADDIAYPARLALQRRYLDEHPNVGAVGTWARFFDDKSKLTVFFHRAKAGTGDARKAMFFNSAIVHPSAMIRADVLRTVGLYDSRFRTAEDYELFWRIATRYDLANIPECLLDYRLSPHGQSLGNRHRQLLDRFRIQWNHREALEWRSWAGMIWTLILFLVPNRWLIGVKSLLKRGPES